MLLIGQRTIQKGSTHKEAKQTQRWSNEPVEFEKKIVDVQDCRKITDHFKGIYRIHLNSIKENRRMSACNRLDLQTLGSHPVMPKNLPDHCTGG